MVGIQNDGPGDAAVVKPVLGSSKGLTVSCGMNPRYGDYDTYYMAASAIDEAIRNSVAVGADPSRIAILDNFCWGYTDRPETLGSLVRAALACYDMAVDLKTPFISGKDSLNNEFSYQNKEGEKVTISIPPTLLISAIGQVEDVATCTTMDVKEAGNVLYQVGVTKCELGGSHWTLVRELEGGAVPTVSTANCNAVFPAVHQAIKSGLVRACHDLSEGGLAVAAAEMAFAGGLGMVIDLAGVPTDQDYSGDTENVLKLFAESNTRFLIEVAPENCSAFEQALDEVTFARIGMITEEDQLVVNNDGEILLTTPIGQLKEAWQSPLRW